MTYNYYSIERGRFGKSIVTVSGVDLEFKSVQRAMKFIDEVLRP